MTGRKKSLKAGYVVLFTLVLEECNNVRHENSLIVKMLTMSHPELIIHSQPDQCI